MNSCFKNNSSVQLKINNQALESAPVSPGDIFKVYGPRIKFKKFKYITNADQKLLFPPLLCDYLDSADRILNMQNQNRMIRRELSAICSRHSFA